MSTTRNQRSTNNQQENYESASEYLVSPIVTENNHFVDHDVRSPGPSRSKSPRVESSALESLRTSLKDEITSELKSLSADSQKEILRLFEAKTNTNVREAPDEDTEIETRSFYTPTESGRINSTRNNDPCSSRNTVTGVLNDSTNQRKRPKIRSQSQPASKERPIVAKKLFATGKNDGTTLLLPRALTASLSTFDGKSEKFELFEDLFRKNIKMYPHFTEIQKINNFYSLLIGTPYKRSAT